MGDETETSDKTEMDDRTVVYLGDAGGFYKNTDIVFKFGERVLIRTVDDELYLGYLVNVDSAFNLTGVIKHGRNSEILGDFSVESDQIKEAYLIKDSNQV